MEKDELKTFLKLASELDVDGDARTADEIDRMIKEALNLRQLLDPSERAIKQVERGGRQTRFLKRQRERAADEIIRLRGTKGLSGGGAAQVGRGGLFETLKASLGPIIKQHQTIIQQFPDAVRDATTLQNAQIQALKAANPAYSGKSITDLYKDPNFVRDLQDAMRQNAADNYVVRLHKSTFNTIDKIIAEARTTLGSSATEEEVLKYAYVNYNKALGADSPIPASYFTARYKGENIPLKDFWTTFGTFRKVPRAPLVALGLAAGIPIGYLLNQSGKDDKPTDMPTPKSDFELKLENEKRQRSRAGQYDIPETTLDAYLIAKTTKGVFARGKTTKVELYDMALAEKGEHFANNLIQYVGKTMGFGPGDERTSVIQ